MGNVIVCLFRALASGGGFDFGQCLRDLAPPPHPCGGPSRDVNVRIQNVDDDHPSKTDIICSAGSDSAKIVSESFDSNCGFNAFGIICESTGLVSHNFCCDGGGSLQVTVSNQLGDVGDPLDVTMDPNDGFNNVMFVSDILCTTDPDDNTVFCEGVNPFLQVGATFS